MDQQAKPLAVLARFPDLNERKAAALDSGETLGGGVLASTGRLIGQAVSVKLLAGIMLFLLVGAVLPFAIGRNRPATDKLSSNELRSTDAAETAAILADPASVRDAAAVQPSARRSVVLVPVTAEPSAAPAIVPSRFEVESEVPSGLAAETPQMSSWPNPAPADAANFGAENRQPGADAGMPTAIRPPEHRAGAIR